VYVHRGGPADLLATPRHGRYRDQVPPFVTGLDLAESFYREVVRPLIGVAHTACLIGEGSEVLGFDTERSTDHEWGPRVQVFVEPGDVEAVRARITAGLPEQHRGYPTRWFSLATGQVDDHVEVDTVDGWLGRRLPTIPTGLPDAADWLTTPQQHLLQLTRGRVFGDELGGLTRLRERYAWYPRDVWRWIVAAQWRLIGTTEPLLGRVVETGDERGARLLTGRLCRLIMEMVHLQERAYWPYDKWFGHSFAGLASARTLGPLLGAALDETPSLRADAPIHRALLELAERHNDLGLSEPVVPAVTDFAVHINDAMRPYPVLTSDRLVESTVDAITDVALKEFPLVGSVDQLTHADDLLINFSSWPGALTQTYRELMRRPG